MHGPFPSSLSSLSQELLLSVPMNSKSISLSHVSHLVQATVIPWWASASFSWLFCLHFLLPHFYHTTIQHLCIRISDLFISSSMLSPSTVCRCILSLRAGWPGMIWACPLLWFHLLVLPCVHSIFPWCMPLWRFNTFSSFSFQSHSLLGLFCLQESDQIFTCWVPSNSDFSSLITFSQS